MRLCRPPVRFEMKDVSTLRSVRLRQLRIERQRLGHRVAGARLSLGRGHPPVDAEDRIAIGQAGIGGRKCGVEAQGLFEARDRRTDHRR